MTEIIGVKDINWIVLRSNQVDSKEFPITKLSPVDRPIPRPTAIKVVPPEDVDTAASVGERTSNLSRDLIIVSLLWTLRLN